jgi:hypothetical protein
MPRHASFQMWIRSRTRRSALLAPLAAAGAFLGLAALAAAPQVRAADAAFKPVGFVRTGFGVPGNSPFIHGNLALLNGGEGDLTVVDLSDKRNPKVAGFVPSFYFTTYVYPLLSKDLVYLSNSKGGLLYIRGLRTLATDGKVELTPWNHSKWGPAFLAGLRPDGIGYSVMEGEIVVLDMSDPQQLRELARISQPGLKPRARPHHPQGLSFSPDFKTSAVLGEDGRTIRMLRWDSPTKATQVAEIENVSHTDSAGTAYGRILSMTDRLLVLGHPKLSSALPRFPMVSFWDISNPAAPRKLSEHTFGTGSTSIRDIALSPDGTRAYVVDGQNPPGGHTVLRWQRSRLFVMDLSMPSAPRVLATHEEALPTEYNAVTLRGNTLYIGDYNYGLWTFDVSDPAKPVKLGGVPSAAEGHWAYLHENYAYMAHTFGGTIQIIDVADVRKPRIAGYYWDGQWLNHRAKVRGKGNAMYIPAWDGLTVVDLTRPASPKRVGEFLDATGGPLQQPTVAISGNYAYAAMAPRRPPKGSPATLKPAPSQLLVYDVADPLAPKLLGSLEIPGGTGFKVAVSGANVYLVGFLGKRFLTVSVSDPRQPRITAEFAQPEADFGGQTLPTSLKDASGNGAPGVEVYRGHLYVTTGGISPAEPYVLIFDVSSPTAIRPAGALFNKERRQHLSCDIEIDGDQLYLVDYGSVAQYDLRDPLRPVRTAQTFMKFSWGVGVIRGGHLFMPKLDGLQIYDVP